LTRIVSDLITLALFLETKVLAASLEEVSEEIKNRINASPPSLII
jgi:hypothetical protein